MYSVPPDLWHCAQLRKSEKFLFRNRVACLSWKFMTWWVLCFLFACFSLAIWDVFVGSCCSVTRWCLTLWDPMNCSTPWFPVFQYLWVFAQGHVHELMICKRLWKNRIRKRRKKTNHHRCQDTPSLWELLTLIFTNNILHAHLLYFMFYVICLAVLGLSCGMQDLHCVMWDLSLWHTD